MDNLEKTVQDLRDQYIGQRIGPYYAWNPVNRSQVWQWCTAMGDNNTLYLGGDEVIAPPTMLQMWAFRDVHGKYAEGSTDKDVYEVLGRLDELGYAGTVAVNYDQTYHNYLKEGDKVHNFSTIINITEKKSTGLGEGYFVTERAEYYNQRDELFGAAEVTYFKYLPPEQAVSASSSNELQKIERIRPVENHDTKHYWQGLRDGKLLIQKCDSCQTHRHPPQPMCEKCQSLNWSTIESTSAGRIHSFTVMHYPEIPPFDYPNAIVLVDLDDGVRITSQLEGVEPEDIKIGSRVIAQIKEVQEGLCLPIFTLDTSSTNQQEENNDDK